MELNTQLMKDYANFLEEKSHAIMALCNALNLNLSVAAQCMDQQSGHAAAARMGQNIENLKKSVPISDDACKRLILALKHVDAARQVFGR